MNKCIDGKFTLLTSSGGVLATNKDAETILEKLGEHVGRLECPCIVEIENIEYGLETFNIIAGTGTTATEIRATINNDVFSYSTEWQSVAGVGLEITGTPDMFSLFETALQNQAETWITLEGTNNGGLSVCASVTIPILGEHDTELLTPETYVLGDTYSVPDCNGALTYDVLYTNTDDAVIVGDELTVSEATGGQYYVVIGAYCDGLLIAVLTLEIDAETIQGLRLLYTPGNLPANNLAAWNTFFGLPANGTPFTSMLENGDEVILSGGSGITISNDLFTISELEEIEDQTNCVIAAGNSCFLSCTFATTFTLPALVTAGDSCFEGCTSATTFTMPALVTTGDSCFEGCTYITTFTLPALETAGNRCFNTCPSATTFTLPALETAGGGCFQNCTSATTFTLPALVTAGDNFFASCTLLTTVTMPVLTALGTTTGNNTVFLGCTALTSVTVPTALATVDGGNPDGDLVYANGTLGATITYV